MAFYDGIFSFFGLDDWCGNNSVGGEQSEVLTMDQLIAQSQGKGLDGVPEDFFPFPSFDKIHESCSIFPRSRDLTAALENGFLAVKDGIKLFLDPLTQPLSWVLDGSLFFFLALPWWVMIPLLVGVTWFVSRHKATTIFVGLTFLLLAMIDHLDYALQTLAIIFICTFICILLGVPIGIWMARSDKVQRSAIPILDILQTLPPFVYLIPLIFLFSVTEPKLYGIAIILYAIVPVVRLTDLGIRLVNKEVIEAADAFGMSERQKLWTVQMPLALPNIMAGVNQTIMMSLAMVVIASLVSAPGLGVLVLRGIRNLELGVGIVAGLGIVLLAVVLDRTSKAALSRIDVTHARD